MMSSVYESMHLLMYYGKWSFTEVYNLPVQLREWFLKRLTQTKKEEADAQEPKNKSRK